MRHDLTCELGAWYRFTVGSQPERVLGRYALFDEIASGGMATVHYGRLLGDAGFARTVAVKCLHAQYAKDPEFATMFLDEARLASRIRHPNVVQTLDVVELDGELFLVMELVLGEALNRILRASAAHGTPASPEIASAIVCSILHGLHAAHEATSDRGEPLAIVHRDVSPANVLVGADGIVRLIDFGVAKAAHRLHTTRDGSVKGKLAYMSPEQLNGKKLDRRSDLFATGAVLWEILTGEPLFRGETEAATVSRVLELEIEPPSRRSPGVPKALDPVVKKALERSPAKRFASAREMAHAIEAAVPNASPTRVAAWLEETVGDVIAERSRTLARVEQIAKIESASASATHPDEANEANEKGRPPSDPTNLTVSSARVRPLRRDVVRWGSYAIVAIAAGGAGLFLARTRSRPAATALASSLPSASDAPGSREAPVPSAPSSPSGPPSTVPPPFKRASTPARPHPRPPAPAASKGPCSPSYVDENGIKQYRSCP
jgi:serine/threonine-protein kinase